MTPPHPGGDWRGAWCSDDVHGEKKRSEARKHENLTDGVPHAPSPFRWQKPNIPNGCSPSLAPSCLRGDATKVQQRWVAVEGKSQKRAGGRGDQSWDTAAASTKLDSSQTLPRESYRRPFTKTWLELETSGLHITEPDKNSERRCQRFCKLLSKAGAVHMLKRERGERKKPHHIWDLWSSSTPVT